MIVLCGLTPAQTNDFDVDAMLDSAQQFAQDNLDPDVLRALQEVDRGEGRGFSQPLSGLSSGRLCAGRGAVERTRPTPSCRCWTRTRKRSLTRHGCGSRLDYFDAAEELKSRRADRQNRNRENPCRRPESDVPGGAGNLDQKSFAAPVAEKRGGIRAGIKSDFHGERRAGGTGLAGGSGIRF